MPLTRDQILEILANGGGPGSGIDFGTTPEWYEDPNAAIPGVPIPQRPTWDDLRNNAAAEIKARDNPGSLTGGNIVGMPMPVAYGRVRVVPKVPLLYQDSDGNRIGFGILGRGPWAGPDRFFVNRQIIDTSDTNIFRFYQGYEGTLGHGLAPDGAGGGNQYVDTFWNNIPAAAQRVSFSGMAYCAFFIPPDPGAPTPDLELLGDFRALMVRIFDDSGAQTSFAWSASPAWQIVDAMLRYKIKPEALANAALTSGEKARFDWPSFVDSAAYCAENVGGVPRFESHVYAAQRMPLAQLIDAILLQCRGFLLEANGKIRMYVDKPRSSVFTLTSAHILPGSFRASKAKLRAAPNHLVAQFNDLTGTPLAEIASIGRAGGVVTVTTTADHPLLVGDNVEIFGVPATVTDFNGSFVVASASSTTFTYAQAGADEAAADGYVTMPETRFAARTEIQDHEQHQYAVGPRGLGLSRLPQRNPQTIDFQNARYSQVNRLLKYRKTRSLGVDAAPYRGPYSAVVIASAEAVDADGNALIAVRPGSRITLDKSVSEEHQGDYEVIERVLHPPALEGGELIEWSLDRYIEDAFIDVADTDPQLAALPARLGETRATIYINRDGIYRTGEYHQSAARQPSTTSQGGSRVGTSSAPNTWYVMGSFQVVIPERAKIYKGQLTIDNVTPNPPPNYQAHGKIEIGGQDSNEIVAPTGGPLTAEVSISNPATGSVTVTVWAMSEGFSNTLSCYFDQVTYVDQDPGHFL